MKLHVLIAHNDYQLAGGEANVAENDARMLAAYGHSVSWYRRDNAEIADYGMLAKLRMAFGTFFSFRTYREARALIRENGIDIVHVHNTVPLISPSIYYAAWAERVPVVQTIHNYRFLCPNGVFYRDNAVCEECLQHGLRRSVRYGCYRHSRVQTLALAGAIALHRLLGTYRKIEACACLTAFAAEKLSHVVPAKHIFIKPNSVRVEVLPIPYTEHGEAYVFLGRLDAEKGVWTLLDAFAKLPQHKLVVIGAGPMEADMRACIDEKKLTNVTMAGQLPHEAAIAWVATARALIMPTQLYEGMPLTVLEAFALGTPVLGSSFGNVGAIIRAQGGGYTFDQTSAEALADCVLQCTGERLREASEKALRAARDVYGEERNYETLLAIYDAARRERGKDDA